MPYKRITQENNVCHQVFCSWKKAEAIDIFEVLDVEFRLEFVLIKQKI